MTSKHQRYFTTSVPPCLSDWLYLSCWLHVVLFCFVFCDFYYWSFFPFSLWSPFFLSFLFIFCSPSLSSFFHCLGSLPFFFIFFYSSSFCFINYFLNLNCQVSEHCHSFSDYSLHSISLFPLHILQFPKIQMIILWTPDFILLYSTSSITLICSLPS